VGVTPHQGHGQRRGRVKGRSRQRGRAREDGSHEAVITESRMPSAAIEVCWRGRAGGAERRLSDLGRASVRPPAVNQVWRTDPTSSQPHKFYGGLDLHARTMVPLHLGSGWGDRAAPAYEGGSRTISQGHGPLS
jgi:hypothetical protein